MVLLFMPIYQQLDICTEQVDMFEDLELLLDSALVLELISIGIQRQRCNNPMLIKVRWLHVELLIYMYASSILNPKSFIRTDASWSFELDI
jgi:hypothetical protein